jgi:hypothetical protein
MEVPTAEPFVSDVYGSAIEATAGERPRFDCYVMG